ncbi:MAG: GatB/YqeY domain-containing protein, partial [Nitrosopumilus sp.]
MSEKDLIKESQLTDEEIVEVISFEAKKGKEAILEFKKGERQDLVGKEKKELEILQKYLPEQLSEEEIKKLVKEAIKKVGAQEIKDTGKVMAEMMPQVKGKA